jgi:hypothetical protein
MADAYKVLHDTSLPKPIRTATTVDDVVIEETVGVAYRAGDYVLESELTQATKEAVEEGAYEGTLEDASAEDAEAARAAEVGVFIPEHEAERYALVQQGFRVVEKDQLLDLRAAGADAAKAEMEASREGPNDANPLITESDAFVEVSDITTSQNEGQPVLPGEGKQEPVPEEALAGVEQPPGLPVGADMSGAAPSEESSGGSSARTTRRAARRRSGSESGSSDSE